MQAFRSILVDINAMAAAHRAFQKACDLAARVGARVMLVDVAPDLPTGKQQVLLHGAEQALVEQRLATLSALAQSRPDVHVDTAVLRGKPAISIIQEVLQGHHDLVVRAHARDLKPGRRCGAIDTQLLRECPCPVWLVGPVQPRHAPHILAAVDTEDEPVADELNRTILDLALAFAEAERAKVTVLHAWFLYGEELLRSRLDEQELHDTLEEARTSAVSGLASLVAQFGDRAAGVRMECIKGEPHVVIPEFATAEMVDLVVMGTLSRTGIAGFLMGNTAEAVLRELSGSVLTVKPPGFVTPVQLPEKAEPPAVD